jgi:hypothetical protein
MDNRLISIQLTYSDYLELIASLRAFAVTGRPDGGLVFEAGDFKLSFKVSGEYMTQYVPRVLKDLDTAFRMSLRRLVVTLANITEEEPRLTPLSIHLESMRFEHAMPLSPEDRYERAVRLPGQFPVALRQSYGYQYTLVMVLAALGEAGLLLGVRPVRSLSRTEPASEDNNLRERPDHLLACTRCRTTFEKPVRPCPNCGQEAR